MNANSLSKLSVPLICAALFTRVLCFPACAQAPVYVYNSFGPGNTYTLSGWVVAGTDGIPGGAGYGGVAEYFVPQVSGDLDQIQLATYLMSGSSACNFYIAQDNGSGLPGTILESFTGVQTPDNGILTINSVATPLLQAGQEYWLCDEPAYANTGTLWCINSEGVANNFAQENSEWSWQAWSPGGATDSVFSISVVPVPEPSVIGIVLLGACLLLVPNWRSSARSSGVVASVIR